MGPVKHLGLSRAHGEVSSFGPLRLVFWRDGGEDEQHNAGIGEFDVHGLVGGKQFGSLSGDGDSKKFATPAAAAASGRKECTSYASLSSTVGTSSESSVATSNNATTPQHASFMPSMPIMTPPQQSAKEFAAAGKSPLTPLFDQGCIRSFSPSRSPFFPAHTAQQQSLSQKQKMMGNEKNQSQSSGVSKDWDSKPSALPTPPRPQKKDLSYMGIPTTHSTKTSSQTSSSFGPQPPHHYAKEQFKTSTVHNDSNPIWGNAHSSFLDSNHSSNNKEGNSSEDRSTFHIPLQKDDLFPTLQIDGGKIGLEVRLDEEMAPTESLLVGGALSTALGAATAATSVVGMGRQAQNVSNGMEMLGLGTDRLIGRGYVDLMPLLLGLWEESLEHDNTNIDEDRTSQRNNTGKETSREEDAILNEFGRINPSKHKARRRIERMGMLDVWVPLYHPTETSKSSSQDNDTIETSGEVHLLISYEPNGMVPKRDDVVAFESFARRPLGTNSSAVNMGPVITPIVPPLSPLLVTESKGSYLLLEYITSRTVTSVDRTGNVKSSRWERPHRVRIHRNAIFVVERQTFMDAAGNIARLPGDIVLSTPIGQEIAEVSAPIVAGAMELVGPAMLWGKLMIYAGGTSVKVGLAGARAATVAVVTASQEKALERRGEVNNGGGSYIMERDGGGDAGVYGYGGMM